MQIFFLSDLWSTELELQGCWAILSQLLLTLVSCCFHSTKWFPVLLREDITLFSTKKLTLTGQNLPSQLLTFHALPSLFTHFTLLSQREQYFFFLLGADSFKFLGTSLRIISSTFSNSSLFTGFLLSVLNLLKSLLKQANLSFI